MKGRFKARLAGLSLAVSAVAGGAIASTNVEITARGDVPVQCVIVPTSSSVDVGSGASGHNQGPGGPLVSSGSANISASLSCNAPFSVSLQSLNGALVNPAQTPQSGSFATTIPYAIGWSIRLDGGGVLQAAGCESSALRAGPGCLGTSGDSAIDKVFQANVSWAGASSGTPPLAGTFADVVTVRLTPVGW
jgi:hypothetical protein